MPQAPPHLGTLDQAGRCAKQKSEMELRPIAKRKKRLTRKAAEDACRKEVKRRFGTKCVIPGCKEPGAHQHHVVYRSKSRRLKYEPTNRRPVCVGHHQLIHAGVIHLRFDDSGELIIEGPKDVLSFKL